jgi:hypothetical protein
VREFRWPQLATILSITMPAKGKVIQREYTAEEGNSGDPFILVAGVLLLSFVSVIACAIPAWRASQADPMTALRSE